MKNIFTNKIVYDNLTSDIKFDIEKFDFTDYKLSNSEVSNIDTKFYTNGIASTLEKLSTNPTSGLTLGDFWYNTTDKNVYGYTQGEDPSFVPGSSWSNGALMVNSQSRNAGDGTFNSTISAGGFNNGPKNTSDGFDGTSWSSLNTILTSREGSVLGGNDSGAILAAGYGSGFSALQSSETYNGTNWSSGPNLSVGRVQMGGCGDASSFILWSGVSGSFNYYSDMEEYNGTNWSTGSSPVNQGNRKHGSGTSTAAFSAARKIGSTLYATCEEYDGTSWSSAADMLSARIHGSSFGVQNLSIVAGGFSNGNESVKSKSTYKYNGTSWSVAENLNSAATDTGEGSGSGTAGLTFGSSYSTAIYQYFPFCEYYLYDDVAPIINTTVEFSLTD